MKRLLLFALVLGLPAALNAQDIHSNKVALKFSCSCKDPAGSAFATALRDLIAGSPRYVETPQSSEKGSDGKDILHWQIKAVSLDPYFGGNAGNTTVLAISFLYGDRLYMDQTVMSCAKSSVSECASDLLSRFDLYMHD